MSPPRDSAFIPKNMVCGFGVCLPSGQDLQSSGRVPGALSNVTYEPFGHFLQLSAT